MNSLTRSACCPRPALLTWVMSRVWRRAPLFVGLAAAALGLATLIDGPSAGAQGTKVRLEVPSEKIEVGNVPFPVEVVVEDVTNLGAFEFSLLYDASLLRFVEVSEGPFLGSSGRVVECLEPRLSAGSVRFVCVTLGREPAGPDGSGTLASITLEPTKPGTSPLRFQLLTLTQPDAQRIEAAAEDASVGIAPVGGEVPPTPVEATPAEGTPASDSTPASARTPASTSTVASTDAGDGGGTNWALWGSVIGAVAVVVVAAAGIAWWSRTRKPI